MPGTMARKLRRWELIGWIAVGVMGPLLHFTYQWSEKSRVAAAFSAINESTWEHMKILFFPLFLVTLVELGTLRYHNFLAVKLVAILSGVALIPVLYYTYTGIWGQSLQVVDVIIYYIAAGATGVITCLLSERGKLVGGWKQVAGALGLLVMAVLFIWFTYRTPQLAVFRDPITGRFGL